MKEEKSANIGVWAFLLGIVIAIIAGFLMPANGMAILALAVLGIIVGLLNITDKELVPYLVANIAFVTGAAGLNAVIVGVGGNEGQIGMIFTPLTGVVNYLVAFVAPGAAVVALKAIYGLAKEA